jgi:hypothetical protein
VQSVESNHVSQEYVVSIFRVEEAKQETREFCLTSCFMLVSYLAYSSTLKMEMTCSSETSIDFQRSTLRYEGRTLHSDEVCMILNMMNLH